MSHMTFYVPTSDVADAADQDGELLAEILNEVTAHATKRWLEEFVEALNEDGRSLLAKLAQAAEREDR